MGSDQAEGEELQIQTGESLYGVLEKEPTKEELQRLIADQLALAAVDPIFFFANLRTIDVHAKGEKVRPYPIHKPYLKRLIRIASTAKKLAIYKSRQMLVTWTMVGIALREALFVPGSYIAFISKKEEDAGKLIGRAKIYLDYMPEHWKYGLPDIDFYRGKKGIYLKMVVRHINGPDSVIQAYPQGGDQARMETFSLAYWDEVGFCDDLMARMTYAALRPTLSGGGRLLMSSTPPRDPEHFWEELCGGRLFGDRDQELRA